MSYKKYEVRVHDNGTKQWRLDGKLHREGGPAIEYADGSKHWLQYGKRHREDGPAIVLADGRKRWLLGGEDLSQQEHAAEMAKRNNSCSGKIVEIEGKKYKLTKL